MKSIQITLNWNQKSPLKTRLNPTTFLHYRTIGKICQYLVENSEQKKLAQQSASYLEKHYITSLLNRYVFDIENQHQAEDSIDTQTFKKNSEILNGHSVHNNQNDLPRVKTEKQFIFIAGSTGFLGSSVLAQLLKSKKYICCCLIRSPAENLIECLKKEHNIELDLKTVQFFHGDVRQPNFGLDEMKWKWLIQHIDQVIHSTGIVNMINSYDSLSETNVDSILNFLKLCCFGKKKTLHFVSSLSVFVGTDQNCGRVMESDTLDNTQNVYGGYAQTKWTAERFLHLLYKTKSDLPPLRIYRMGLLTGSSKTGYTQTKDMLSLFLKGLIHLNCCPSPHSNISIDISPIDWATSSFVSLFENSANFGVKQTFHLANPHPLTLAALSKAVSDFGFPLKLGVSLEEWRNKIRDLKSKREDKIWTNLAFLGLCRCLSPEEYSQYRSLDLFQATSMTLTINSLKDTASTFFFFFSDICFDNSESRLFCEDPPNPGKLISRYLNFLIKETNFLSDITPSPKTIAPHFAQKANCKIPKEFELSRSDIYEAYLNKSHEIPNILSFLSYLRTSYELLDFPNIAEVGKSINQSSLCLHFLNIQDVDLADCFWEWLLWDGM